MDPLITLRGFTDKSDLEIAGLVAALLSYGRVETIIRNCNDLFDRMDRRPAAFIRNSGFKTKVQIFKKFKHRFNTGTDIALLLQAIADIIKKFGSIECFFKHALRRSDTGMHGALTSFSESVTTGIRNISDHLTHGISFIIPSPRNGSACKRLNMYLRWMVRPDDGIDRGVWKRIAPSELIMPVDTHIARITRQMGITTRKTPDWRMAEEVTAYLRRIDPFDPVRFDFSLCREGMVAIRKDAA
jgi:uncharacterized protein (TIGR02757 family)